MVALAPCPPGVDPDAWAGLCGRVRDEAEWHIAPSKTETITVSGRGNDRLVLDTLHLTGVSAVTIGGVSVASPRFTEWGTIYPDPDTWTGWHGGLWHGDVTLTIVHGYDSCPAALLDAMTRAARSQRPAHVPAGRLQAGPFSAEFDDDLPIGLQVQINRYALPGRA